MPLGLSDSVTITVVVASFFALLVLAVIVRAVMRNEPKPWRWRRFRIGIFLERETDAPGERDERKE